MKLNIKLNMKKCINFLVALFVLLLFCKIINRYFFTYEFSDKYEKAEWFYKIQRNKGLSIIEISGNYDKLEPEWYNELKTITPIGIVLLDDKYRIIKKLPIVDDFGMTDIEKSISYSNFAGKTTLLQHIVILKTLKNRKSNAIKFYYN